MLKWGGGFFSKPNNDNSLSPTRERVGVRGHEFTKAET